VANFFFGLIDRYWWDQYISVKICYLAWKLWAPQAYAVCGLPVTYFLTNLVYPFTLRVTKSSIPFTLRVTGIIIRMISSIPFYSTSNGYTSIPFYSTSYGYNKEGRVPRLSDSLQSRFADAYFHLRYSAKGTKGKWRYSSNKAEIEMRHLPVISMCGYVGGRQIKRYGH